MFVGPMVYRVLAAGLVLSLVPAASAATSAPSRSFSSPPARSYSPPPPPMRSAAPSPPPAVSRPAPTPPPAVSRPAPAPTPATPPPSVARPATPPPAVTREATPPPSVTRQATPPPAVTRQATPPPAVTQPAVPKVDQNSFRTALPQGTTSSEAKPLAGGGKVYEIKNAQGQVVSRSTFTADGKPKTVTSTDKAGNTVTTDLNHGYSITTKPNGDKVMVNTKTGETTTRSNAPNNGPQTVSINRGGVNDSYTAQPAQWGNTSHVTVIHQYQPVGGYWGGGCDLFCLMLISSMNNRHYSNDNGYNPPNYNPQQAPRNLDYNWTKLYPNLPADLAVKKTYTDAVDWVGDSVTLGMIESVRDGGTERTKEVNGEKKEECTFFIFGCHTVETAGDADKFSKAYLESLRNFNLDSAARLDITDHAGKILGAIQAKKEIALSDLINKETGDVKEKRVYIFQDAKPMQTADGGSCTLAFGDVVKLQKGDNDNGTVSLEVMQSTNSADESACRSGTNVSMDVSDFQDMENAFAHRVEKALNESKTALASASLH